MTAELPAARVLLLVEDNAADAELVTDILLEAERESYQILRAPRLADALQSLEAMRIDVMVLDLRLPDCAGVDTVRAVHKAAASVPIVVLTGTDDEALALACIEAGAQDYLAKTDVHPRNLKRAIGYAIRRVREAQLCELHDSLERYRALSSANQRTTVTAAMVGSGAISLRSPETFAIITDSYFALLEPFLTRKVDSVGAPRTDMERVVTTLGDANGGPRDLLDVHVAVLDRAIARSDDARSRSIVFEARLLALEMMGLLVDYYRVGYRRQ